MADYVSRAFLLEGMDLSIVAAKAIAGDDSVALKAVEIMQTLRDFVAEAHAAKVVPVVQALWKVGYTDKENKRIGVECSECNAFLIWICLILGCATTAARAAAQEQTEVTGMRKLWLRILRAVRDWRCK